MDDDGQTGPDRLDRALQIGFRAPPGVPWAAVPDVTGRILGGYRLLTGLGAGGMGRVYLARKGDQRFAVKVVHPHLLEAPGFFRRFLREAEIGKSVRHPNVVRTLEFDQVIVDGAPCAFLVMEYVEGQTLRGLLGELSRLPEELCRHVGREVSKGLAAIHGAGAVHRDLKPENVLITEDHEVKVMDLGVARLLDGTLQLSRTGAFVGSVQYASPEQFEGSGDGIDGRSDLYSLGVVLYELACGEHPYPGDGFGVVLARILTEEPPRLGERNPQVSAFFEEVVHALLSKDRTKRFDSASALLTVLSEGESGTWWPERAKAIRAATKRPLRRVRIPRETAVYGREAELSRLRTLYEAVKAGDGRVLLIEGEAGIGKTRLVDEFVGQLSSAGEEVHFLFGSYPPGGAATASGAWSTAYREQFGAEGLTETLKGYLTATPALIPAFAALLRGEPAPEGGEPLRKDSIHTVFVHATRALSRERVTIVLIEDLHFAPEEGRALFAALSLAVPEHRILLLGTARPGLPEPWLSGLARLSQAGRMGLPRLGPKDLVRLLVDAFRSRHLAEELSARIAEKSDGNPFFVFEIIRGLKEGQFIAQQPDGTWATTKVIRDLAVPSSVLDLVNGRIAGLETADRDLLDVAACCGYAFDPTLVAEAAGVPRVSALKRLGQIERAHRLVRSAGRFVEFDHHQVQEALYGSMLEALKAEYHGAIAGVLAVRHPRPAGVDAVELCEHWLRAGQGERALPHLDAALDHLDAGYQNDRAVGLADRALAESGLLAGAARAKILLRMCALSGPLERIGRRPRQEEMAREVERLAGEAGDGVMRGRAAVVLGTVLFRSGRREEAEEAMRRAVDLAREMGDRKSESRAMNTLGLILGRRGCREESIDLFRRSLAASREIGDAQAEAAANGNLAIALESRGLIAESRTHFERSLELSRRIGDRQGEARDAGNLGTILQAQGLREEASRLYERSLELSREIGDRENEARATGNLGSILQARRRYAEALAYSERSLALFRETGERLSEAVNQIMLGILWTDLGMPDRARGLLESALALCGSLGARYIEGSARSALATLFEAEGEDEAARHLHEEVLAHRRAIGHGPGIADTLTDLAEVRWRDGDTAGARVAVEEALALLREQGRPAETVRAEALAACLPGGDGAAAVDAFAAAGESADTPHTRYLLWRATGDRAHLFEAKRLLLEMVEHAPANCRETMVASVRLHREILEAARVAGPPAM
jgi:tetratricopeptide (TPR) repeat protein